MATRGKGQLIDAIGELVFLRVTNTNDVLGVGDDTLKTEVVFQLEGHERALGFDLDVGDKELPNALGMLSLLRDAYIHKVRLRVRYWLEDNTKTTGYVYWVAMDPR